MSFISAESPGGSICFRCSGGRVGASRFRAFLDLFNEISDLTLMVSRRQALDVRGPLGEVPNYLYEELSTEEISGPNVKSYPYLSNDALQDYVVDRLEVLTDETSGVTFSYSPHRLYRGNLRLDDFCFLRNEDGTFTIESRLWSREPRVLIEDIQEQELSILFDALKSLFQDYSSPEKLSERPLRDIRKQLFSYYNRTCSGSKSPPNDIEVNDEPSEKIHERSFVEGDQFRMIYRSEVDENWILIPIVAGVLTDSIIDRLRTVLDRYSILSMRLTPEQNILLPIGDSNEADEIVQELTNVESVPKKESGFTRITTCPGSMFCRNATMNPVELNRRLVKKIRASQKMLEFNSNHPIGITGCGETKTLERRHPIGIYPATIEDYRISLGGILHGYGEPGIELEKTLSPEILPEAIERIIELYVNSSDVPFHDWCQSNDFDLERLVNKP